MNNSKPGTSTAPSKPLICLIEEMYEAYRDARRNKRNSRSQLTFELDLERNIYQLSVELYDMTYKVGPSSCFIVHNPVQREIFAADFRDRVVHHFLFNRIGRTLERKFINDSYSCRKKKGTLYGVQRLQHHTRGATNNFTEQAWILKLDIQGYFMNIPRQKLYTLCAKMLRDEDPLTRYLLREIIFSDPTQGCRIKGSVADWYGLPKTKSLFHTPKNAGLPIGNLTSQLFSNVFLNPFDQFVKRELGVVHYGRYVDDFFLVHKSKPFLLDTIPKIDSYLKDNLGLSLHPRKKYLQRVSSGVEFLGIKVKNGALIPGRRMRQHAIEAVFEANRKVRSKPSICEKEKFVTDFITSANAYLGLMMHINSFKLREKIVRSVDGRLLEKMAVKPPYRYFKLIKN